MPFTPNREPFATEREQRATRLLSALPFAVIALATLVDVTGGPSIGFLPLLALGPAFATLVGGVRRTAAIGALALLLCIALAVYDGLIDSPRGLTAIVSVAGVSLAALAATAGRQRRETELASVRSIAEAAQRVLLRPVPPRTGPLRMAVSYTSAVAEARIGGDLYEVVTSPHGTRLIVGDVQGKGLEAVETAAVVLGAFREAAYDEPDLTAVSARLERALNRHLSGEEFVTAVLVEVEEDHTASLLNYGHPPPLLLRADGTPHFIDPEHPAPPLGLAGLALEGPKPQNLPLEPGDQVLLYTDGVTEARDPANRFYPLSERAFHLTGRDPKTALKTLRKDLQHHTQGPLQDDAVMLLFRYHQPH
jgi:serine phosphatase RsbU (regulator of sigma subunit)